MGKKKLLSMPLGSGLKKFIVPVTVTYTSYVEVIADDIPTAKRESEVLVKNEKKKFRKGATFGIRIGKPTTTDKSKDKANVQTKKDYLLTR